MTPGLSPELRATLYYITSFLSVGTAAAYAGIWFTDRGLSSGEIGLINALPVFASLVLNLLVGQLADRAKDWGQIIRIGAWASAACAAGLFLVDGFWGILFFWSLAAITQGSVAPVMDAATTRLTARRGTNFGPIRAWGTVGYVFAVFATGYIVGWSSGQMFLWLFAGASLLRAFVSLQLPQFRGTETTLQQSGTATSLADMLQPRLFLPLLAWGMIQSTNMILMGFQALLWKQQGLAESTIGSLIALGAVAEAAMLFAYSWLNQRFTPFQLMAAAGLVAAFRLSCFALSPGVFWLVPLQLLHAITFAVGYLGCMSFITRWTAESMAARAQSFSTVLQQCFIIAMFTLFGQLMTSYGAKAYYLAAAIALAGAALALASQYLRQQKTMDAGVPLK